MTQARLLRLLLGVLALPLALCGLAAAGTGPIPERPDLGLSPLAPATTGGLPVVERALAKLTQHRRLLVIGAHPDDEDTSALVLVSRGEGGEAAYLSLSRGEGGQNLIGTELGVPLGLLRSRELLAAREIDGARQYFTRAYDFGFTRSLDETFGKWPEDVLLTDTVRVIRRFRPQVIVSVFPADERAGHGQHQAAGTVAHEAFEKAGRAGAFPELAAQGLAPWAPESLFRATWFDRDSTSLETDLGHLEPLSGKSFFQLAMAARSQHRSQDMGRVQPLGENHGRYRWEAGPGGAGSADLFAGVDTRLEAIAALLPPGAARETASTELAAAREGAEAARARLTPETLPAVAADLAGILGHLRAARRAAGEGGGAGSTVGAGSTEGAAADLIDEKIGVAERALAAAAGVALDAWAERDEVAPGETLRVEAQAWSSSVARGGAPVPVEVVSVELGGDAPWKVAPARGDDGQPIAAPAGPLAPGDLAAWAFEVSPGDAAAPTVPYFLAKPLDGDLYDWSGASGPSDSSVLGEPFGAPPLVARFTLRLAGQQVAIEREVVERVGDQARGEIRRPLRVVPRLEVEVAPDLLVWSTGGEPPASRLEVSLRSNLGRPVAGSVRVEVPAGWPSPDPVSFRITDPYGEAAAELHVTAPAGLTRGRYPLGVVAALSDGSTYRAAYPVVDYPHIRATPYPEPSRLEVAAADIRWPKLGAVGYVRGASDRVPQALEAVGLPLALLSGHDLAERDLSRYDAIVIGSRAYETDPELGRNNARLLDYARRGGLVLVQYQQYPFVDGGYAPYPLEIARPHDRVTDETAPATLLEPASPVFTTPNRIGPEDWQGWVQERGLYFAHTWAPEYTPLLSFPSSPGYPPGDLQGGLLVAKLGDGTYVYTGLAFFRELPAGVTGAYRLFANLLALADRT